MFKTLPPKVTLKPHVGAMSGLHHISIGSGSPTALHCIVDTKQTRSKEHEDTLRVCFAPTMLLSVVHMFKNQPSYTPPFT